MINMLKKVINKVINKQKNLLFLREREWKEIEYFDESWKNRIQRMSTLIPENINSICDVGCGKSWLKEFIEDKITYIGIDYKKRDENTFICDLNNREFPDINVDVAFCSGVFEYVEESNVEWFFQTLNRVANYVIISYCSLELNPIVKVRKSLGWKNHYRKYDFVELVSKFGFQLDAELNPIDGNNIFRFKKVKDLS